jgi:hypothetical protein
MPRSLSSSSRTRRSPLPSLLLFSALFVVCVAAKNASGEDDAGRRNLVVLVHGMGDTCCNPHSLGAIERAILEREGRNNNNNNNNTSKVISIKFGRNGMSDFISGFIGNAYALVEDFGCKQLRRAKEEEEEEEGEKIDGETIVL